MFCSYCGAKNPKDYRFCNACGKARPDLKVRVSVSSSDRWETAKIMFRSWRDRVGNEIGEFWASAIGEKGKYTAGEAPFFLTKLKEANRAHTFLVNQLTFEGWEALAIPSREDWFSIPFRRKIKKNNRKPWQIWVSAAHSKGLTGRYFVLCHAPDSTTPQRGKKHIELEMHGKSEEFKLAWTEWTDGQIAIFNDFVKAMKKEGFLPLESRLNAGLKKCILRIDKNTKDWYPQFFLKRLE